MRWKRGLQPERCITSRALKVSSPNATHRLKIGVGFGRSSGTRQTQLPVLVQPGLVFSVPADVTGTSLNISVQNIIGVFGCFSQPPKCALSRHWATVGVFVASWRSKHTRSLSLQGRWRGCMWRRDYRVGLQRSNGATAAGAKLSRNAGSSRHPVKESSSRPQPVVARRGFFRVFRHRSLAHHVGTFPLSRECYLGQLLLGVLETRPWALGGSSKTSLPAWQA